MTPIGSLAQRAGGAFRWALGLRMTSQALALVRTVVLARLLPPEEFGRMGLALVLLSALDAFTTLGLEQALIHRSDPEEYLDTAWSLGLVRSLGMGLLLIAAARAAEGFFAAPGLMPLAAVVAVAEAARASSSASLVLARKRLDQRRLFVLHAGGIVLDLVVAVAAARALGSALALALGLLAGNLARLCLSYVVAPHRPRFRLAGSRIRELLLYGRSVLAANIVIFLAGNLEGPVLARLLDVAAFGLYVLAVRLALQPLNELRFAVNEVSLPAFAALRGEPARLREAFLSVHELLAGATILGSGVLVALAPFLVRTVLGPAWLEAVPAVRILALVAAVRGLVASGGPLFLAVGKPELDFRMNALRLPVLLLAVVPLVSAYGATGAALAALLGMCAHVPAFVLYTRRILSLPLAALLAPTAPIAAASLAGILAVRLAEPALAGLAAHAGLIALLLGGMLHVIAVVGAAALIAQLTGWDVLARLRSVRRLLLPA